MKRINPIVVNTLRSYAEKAGPEQINNLRKKISHIVGQMFFGSILSQVEKEFDMNNPLNGGRAGRIFRAQLYDKLIENISKSNQFGIGKRIADTWLGLDAYKNAITTPSKGNIVDKFAG